MTNFLFIITDEQRRDAFSCAGGIARTPHLDRLAARGTRFLNAYTPSPICVPARAALACGDHVHRLRLWDSATPFDGSTRSWMARIRETGAPCVSIGKLHFRGPEDDNGWSEEILPMHVAGGVGWWQALMRDRPVDYSKLAAELAAGVGVGESDYTAYDRAIAAAAEDWLGAHGGGGPWALSVSFVSPHYPLTCPAEFFELYEPSRLSRPVGEGQPPDHPELRRIADFFCYERYFEPERAARGRAAYFGLTSFVDHLIGRVLAALEASGGLDDTVIVMTSDHGDMLGEHGMWTKQTMYESSAGVPLIVAGGGAPEGAARATPASLIDVYPTALEVMGVAADEDERALPGRSLLGLARRADDPGRAGFSEYHDGGSTTGFFMIRFGRWKYVHYVGERAQLFDLAADPGERHDLSSIPDAQPALAEGAARLRAICDPDAVNAQAFADQHARLKALGGAERLSSELSFNHTPTPLAG